MQRSVEKKPFKQHRRRAKEEARQIHILHKVDKSILSNKIAQSLLQTGRLEHCAPLPSSEAGLSLLLSCQCVCGRQSQGVAGLQSY